jgi:predicted amidohydrolase
MSQHITAAAIQTHPVFGEPERNREAALDALQALPRSCDLAVLPELFATGYQFRTREEAWALAETVPDGPTCDWLGEAAARLDLHLVAGLCERAGDQLFNSCVLMRPDGSWDLYRKIHLFWNEKTIFMPGDMGFKVCDGCGTRLGLMICFDWIYPEAARTLALAGATVLCHPSNLVLPHCPHSMPVRCIENRVFAITANRVGVEHRTAGPLTFIGRSQIVDPDGERLAVCDEENAGTALATLDLSQTHKQVTPRNDLWRDRRPQMYRL